MSDIYRMLQLRLIDTPTSYNLHSTKRYSYNGLKLERNILFSIVNVDIIVLWKLGCVLKVGMCGFDAHNDQNVLMK